MRVDMPGMLNQTAKVLCRALETMLTELDQNWWARCVLGKLSFQQKQQAEQRGLSRLGQLDLAALLRVLDQNWDELADSRQWPYEKRNFLKEMQTVRNRWMHAPSTGFPDEDIYRDLDTMHRFLLFLCPGDDLTEKIAAAKRGILVTPAHLQPVPLPPAPDPAPVAPPPQSRTALSPGSLVRLRADPAKSGAVTSVLNGDKETRYQVFLDGKVGTYYESQLIAGEVTGATTAVVPLAEFHARLTALQLLHPSISNLYSLHAARIEVIPYQFRPVLKFIRSDRPRLLIADSVGVGKTIEAGLILRELQARRDIRRVLIACPRPLVTEGKWLTEMKRFDERFEHLDGPRLRHCLSEMNLDGVWPERYEKVIVPFSQLTAELLDGKGKSKGLRALDPPPRFDLVIVDEAHHIRHTDAQRHQVIRFLCDHAEAVLFLTATPIQTSERDLYVLLHTLCPDLIENETAYAAITEPNGAINQAAAIARKGEPGWSTQAREALQQAARTAWGKSVLQRDPRFQEVFDSLADAEQDRSARVQALGAIEELHTLSRFMTRTLRRDIGEFTQRKPETVAVPFSPEQQELHDAVIAAQAAVYAALHGDQAVNFLLTTIRRQAASCIHGLAPLLREILSRKLKALEWDEIEEDSGEATETARAVTRIKDLIAKVLAQAEKLPTDPATDPKFLALKKILDEKRALPNNRVMLFSSFRHTLFYLDSALRRADCRVGLVYGDVSDDVRMSLRARFEMDRGAPDALDVLLFSEVGCEGLDYQFCDCMVNYDLPWNPMRIDQRIGRIDRWGQRSEAVAIYNLIVPGTIDADIYTRCLLRIGIFEHALGANEEILGRITSEITSVGENLSLSPAERQARLDQLADNGIRLLKEQQDLEMRQTELFGLHVPHDRFRQDVEDASSYWLSATALERLVSLYLCSRAGKESAPLAGEGPKKLLRLSRDVRNLLLKDFKALSRRRTAIARDWEDWLKGAVPHLAVTFDSACAVKDRGITLLTPVHPLAIQAAQAITATGQEVPFTGISVKTAAFPPGDYPFAIYQWQYHGIRNDVEFVPVTAEPALTAEFLKLMPEASDFAAAPAAVTKDVRTALERQQYQRWSDARAQHLDRTMRDVDFRRGSLETTHKSRLAVLDGQLAGATDERIRVMRGAEKANAHADYDRRRAEIEEAAAKADIITQHVGFGIIRVVSQLA